MLRPHVLLAFLVASCGDGGTGKPAEPEDTQCKPEDRGSATPGDLESAITTGLRQDAGIEAIFGDRTQAILDEADALRAEASGEAASAAGLPVPPEDAPPLGGLCTSVSGLTAQAWAFRSMAMSHAVSSLPMLIDFIPVSISHEGTGLRANETGDPTVTATYNAYFSGNGKSEVSVEVRGVMDISSPTKGSIHEDNVASVSLDVCPDESGHARGKVHFKFGGIAAPASGDPFSYGATMDSDFRFEVDDEAEIARLVIDSTMVYAATGAHAVNVAGHGSLTFTGENVTAATINWDHQDASLASVGLVQREIFNAALMAAVISRDKARSKWRDGTCVEIKTDREGGEVPAQREVSITATARQKLEQQDLQVPIQGWLEGSASLTPNAQYQPSPATLRYTPGANQQTGTVHLESKSKRGIGKKDLVFTASGGGWSGQITWTVSGSSDSSADMWTYHWDGDGEGKILVRPGMFGMGEVDSASFTYTQNYNESWASSYEQNGCQHSASQTRDEVLTGTGTEGALVILTVDEAGNYNLVAGPPYGSIMGEMATRATDAVTGPPERCHSPADTNMTSPSSGSLPSVSLTVSGIGTPDQISGSKSVHLDGEPPLDFEFSYALSR